MIAYIIDLLFYMYTTCKKNPTKQIGIKHNSNNNCLKNKNNWILLL